MKIYCYPKKTLNYDEKKLASLEKWSIEKEVHSSDFVCTSTPQEGKTEYFIVEASENNSSLRWLFKDKAALEKGVNLKYQHIASNLVQSYQSSNLSLDNLYYNNSKGKGDLIFFKHTDFSHRETNHYSCEDGTTDMGRRPPNL